MPERISQVQKGTAFCDNDNDDPWLQKRKLGLSYLHDSREGFRSAYQHSSTLDQAGSELRLRGLLMMHPLHRASSLVSCGNASTNAPS